MDEIVKAARCAMRADRRMMELPGDELRAALALAWLRRRFW